MPELGKGGDCGPTPGSSERARGFECYSMCLIRRPRTELSLPLFAGRWYCGVNDAELTVALTEHWPEDLAACRTPSRRNPRSFYVVEGERIVTLLYRTVLVPK